LPLASSPGGKLTVDDYTDIERLAELQRLEQTIAEAKRRKRELTGSSSPNGETNHFAVSAIATIVKGSEITPTNIRWIWKGWLAEGKLEILAGAVSAGKTTISLEFAATITREGTWPDGTKAERGDVLVWSGEDDPADTLLPRFLAAGGDRDRIHFVKDLIVDGKKRPFDPSSDMGALTRAAQSMSDLKLVVVDPVVLMVAGDSHKNTEVRRSLQPLAELAVTRRCTALGITHLTKGTAGQDPIERITGSLAFAAGPRLALMAAKPLDPAQQKRRLVRIKSNIGPDGDGFEYYLRQEQLVGWDGLSGQRIFWGDPLYGTARDLLNDIELSENGAATTPKRDTATQFLRDVLKDGAMPTTWIQNAAKHAGLSWRTVQRACADLGVVASRIGGIAGEGEWQWQLPDDLPPGGATDL
jgi:putative DNA primase/helicase